MGLFDRKSKPGKGVMRRTKPQNRFVLFFSILFRKFLSFMNLSVIYGVAILPTLIPLLLVMGLASAPLVAGMEEGFSSVMDLFYRVVFSYLFAVLWGMGPATAGITYVTRNWADETHAWIWNDFKKAAADNWKQAIAVYLADVVIFVLLYLSLQIYGTMEGFLGSLRYLVIVFGVVYTMMHFYLYPMMVTFQMSLKELYKNSLMLAIGKLPVNLMLLAVLLLLHGGGFCLTLVRNNGFILVVMMLLESVLLFGISSYFLNFHVYPTLKGYMKQ